MPSFNLGKAFFVKFRIFLKYDFIEKYSRKFIGRIPVVFFAESFRGKVGKPCLGKGCIGGNRKKKLWYPEAPSKDMAVFRTVTYWDF